MKKKSSNMRIVSFILTVSLSLYGNGFVSFANAKPTQPTPFSQDELVILEQAEMDSREILPVVIAGENSSNDALVIALAAVGILAIIGVIIAASQEDEEDSEY